MLTFNVDDKHWAYLTVSRGRAVRVNAGVALYSAADAACDEPALLSCAVLNCEATRRLFEKNVGLIINDDLREQTDL